MAAKHFKHNRKRNSGLIYEFLVRRMATQILDHDEKGYKKSLEIITRYYADGSSLREEKDLFDVIQTTRGVSEQVARQVVAKVKEHASRLDKWKIDVKKSNLIKDINYAFGKDFFSRHRINEYRLFASIQMVVDSCKANHDKKTINESVQVMQLEEALVKFMTFEQPQKRPDSEEKVDSLVCAIAAKKFQEKYGSSLNRDQKTLIEKYMRCMMTGENEEFVAHLSDEKRRIAIELHKSDSMKEIKEDSVMRDRLNEAKKKLSNVDVSSASEESVQEMMLFQKLVEELTSNE
jgi:hypothetical protein